MADDFLPRADQAFCQWLNNFLRGTTRGDRVARLKLTEKELQRLREGCTALEDALAEQMQLQRQAAAARVSKDALRRKWEKEVRTLARHLQHSAGITNRDRVDLGLRIRRVPVTSAAAAAATPATTPRLRAQSLPLRHLLHFVDENTPTRKRKPSRGVNCEIWWGRLPAPQRGSRKHAAAGSKAELSWQFLTVCSATPHTVLFTPAEVGQLVSYRCRWVSNRGKQGPWSNTVTTLVSE